MKVTEEMWEMLKEHLGYTDDELKKLRENPDNEAILSMTPELMKKTVVLEVVESHGCNSQHKVGDKLYLDTGGNLLTKLNPARVCIYALHSLTPLLYASTELMLAGVDPNEMKLKRAGCIDVGVHCGGWGKVVFEIRVVDRKGG